MNELALFAGIGGGILGGKLLGWRTVCAVEINAYCRRVLMQRQDDGILEPFPVWDDVRTFDGTPWRGAVDVVTAGWPCLPFSTAARGRNNAPDMFSEVVRIVDEVRPSFVFLENVLVRSYPPELRAATIRVGASDVGAPHRRPRQWLVAHVDRDRELCRSVDAKVAGIPLFGEVAWWQDVPDSVLGMDDGLPNRVDRLRALGNAQVPLVAATAWRVLTE